MSKLKQYLHRLTQNFDLSPRLSKSNKFIYILVRFLMNHLFAMCIIFKYTGETKEVLFLSVPLWLND